MFNMNPFFISFYFAILNSPECNDENKLFVKLNYIIYWQYDNLVTINSRLPISQRQNEVIPQFPTKVLYNAFYFNLSIQTSTKHLYMAMDTVCLQRQPCQPVPLLGTRFISFHESTGDAQSWDAELQHLADK